MFIWTEKELNTEQSNAITDENNILLVACPGSGKTRTLTYKIALELSKIKSTKQYIIAITYTNRAAEEIKERIELLGVETRQLWIGTVHSFCLEWILRPYSLYLPEFKKGYKVIDAHDSEEILSELCSKYNAKHNLKGKNKISYWDCGYISTSKEIKITTLSTHKKEAVKIILQEYLQILKNNNQIDFELILHYSLKLLKKHSKIASVLSKIFSIILIDEYQDTKEIQYYIISLILKANQPNIKIFIVGDPNQSIYQNLGGYPIQKTDLETLCGLNIKCLGLTKNYRSSEKIIGYFDYFKTFDNEIVAEGSISTYNSIISLNGTVTKTYLIDEIANIIEYNVKKLKIPENQICVVAPQWVHLASATKQLILKLPNYSFDSPGMTPFSRDIENFWFRLSRIVLTEASPNLYIRRLRWGTELLQELNSTGVDITRIDKKRLLKLCNAINITETDGIMYLRLFFEELCNRLGILISDFPMLQEHHTSFFASAEKRIQRLLNDGIDYINHVDTFKKVFQQQKGITVSTYHGVKGAEYDTVIAFALLHDYIPHFSDTEGDENSKKLLYVIASRARQNLYLISEKGRSKSWGAPYAMTKHLREYDYLYDLTYHK